MRTVLKILLPMTFVLGLAAVAAAQDSEREIRPDTEFTFDDDEVIGETDNPMGSLLQWRPRPQRVTLVRPRTHFVPEMLRSIERI